MTISIIICVNQKIGKCECRGVLWGRWRARSGGWALLTGVIANRLMRQRTVLRADALQFLAIIVIGPMTGPSLMYGWMMTAA